MTAVARAARDGRLAEPAAALLLGGASRRMGRDKARLTVAGVPLVVGLGRLLDGLFEELLLVGGDPPAQAPGRRVADPPGPRCALRGVVAALTAARAPRVLLVATDMPRLTPELLLGLASWPEAGAVAPRDAGGWHPLCAVYAREPALAVARAHLEAGRLRLSDLLAALETRALEGDALQRLDPEGSALTNVNTPDDLAAL